MRYLWALHLVVCVCDGTVVVSVAVPIVSVVIGRTAGSTWGQETWLQMWILFHSNQDNLSCPTVCVCVLVCE